MPSFRIHRLKDHLRQNFLGQLAADLSLRDQRHQPAQVLRTHRRIFDFLALGLELTEPFMQICK